MESTKKTWTKSLAGSWNKWTPPDRPSPGELKTYEEVLKQILGRKKKPNVMVLGSTSEFRDVFSKYKLPCTVVEYNEENYRLLGSLMKRKKFKETLVVGDWRTVKLKQKFDLIIGDFCLNVIPKADVPVFVANIAGLLGPQGMCMLKTFARYDSVRGDLAERLQFYRTKMKHRPILESIMASMFKSVYNYEAEVGSFVDLWHNFVSLERAGKMTKDELQYFADLNIKDISLKYYIPNFVELCKTIEANATLYGVRFGGEWFSVDVPVVMFKK